MMLKFVLIILKRQNSFDLNIGKVLNLNLMIKRLLVCLRFVGDSC